MYYFDNEESDAPTTIIDLELFDQISRVGDVLIVDASTESDKNHCILRMRILKF